MTEDELVAALSAVVERPLGPRVCVSIGDDAAVWQPSRSHRSVITTDALIEDVHFTRGGMSAADVGHRALAANLSDIAAMGAKPVLATVALGFPAGTEPEWIVEVYRGMAALADATGTRIVGGDIVRAPVVTLSITIVGEVSPSRLKLRSGGKPGDILAVTGPLGASRAGLAAIANAKLGDQASREAALLAHRRPMPRLSEGRWLAASHSVRAVIDLSDGIGTDLARLCAASGCGADVENVPVASCVGPIARAAGDDPDEYALCGGEDYELLAAIAPRAFGYLAGRFARRFGRPLLAVGKLLAGECTVTRITQGRARVIKPGFDHLYVPTG